MRRANSLCTLLRAATSRCHSRSIALPIRSAGAFWCCVCARDRLRLAFADNPNLPFRVCATTGGGGDTCCISTWRFVVSVRAGVTNDVATSEVAKVLSASPPRLLNERARLLWHLALLAQSQKKSNESNRGMLDTRAQGAHEIPNTRSRLQQPTL